MEPMHQTGLGLSLSWIAILSFLTQDVYPILSFIAVTCGAILGLHGVWALIRNKYFKDDGQNYF